MDSKRLGPLAAVLPVIAMVGCTDDVPPMAPMYGPMTCTSDSECSYYTGGFCNQQTKRCDVDQDAAAGKDGDAPWFDVGPETAPDVAWDSIDEGDALPGETGDDGAADVLTDPVVDEDASDGE